MPPRLRSSPMSQPVPATDRSPLAKVLSYARVFYHWRIRQSRVVPYLPSEISIEMTNRCNFKCHFCPQSSPTHFDNVPASALSPERATLFLDKIRRGGASTSIIHWTLDGEPFMNKRFAEIAHLAVERGFKTHHFATNGTFVTPERLRDFPLQPDVKFFLTTDFCSDRKYFEEVRGTAGSWETVKSNITNVLSDPKLSSFHFKVTDISSYSIEDPAELERRYAELQAILPKSDRITFHRRVFHNMTGYLSLGKKKQRYNLCPYPWFSFFIANNGDVVACCRDLEHKTVLGNLLEQEFDEIWNGEKYRELRAALVEKRPDDAAACAGCDMPYDDSKYSLRNMAKGIIHRAHLLERT